MLNPTTAARCCDPLWDKQAAERDEARLTLGHQAALTGAQRRGHARSRSGLVPGSTDPPGPPTGVWLSPMPKAPGGWSGDQQGEDRALLSLGRGTPQRSLLGG